MCVHAGQTLPKKAVWSNEFTTGSKETGYTFIVVGGQPYITVWGPGVTPTGGKCPSLFHIPHRCDHN